MSQLPEFSFCFDNAACGLVVTEADGTIKRVNATFAKWLGYEPAELVASKKIQDLFTVGGRFFHHTHWAPLLQMQGSVSEVQIDVKARDGKVIPMLVNAARHSHGGTVIDQLAFIIVYDRKKFEQELISARKKIEASLTSLRITQEELKHNQSILNLAMHNAKMAGWILEVDAKRVEWNQELQSLLGFESENQWLSLEDFYGLVHQDDRLTFKHQLQQAVENKSNYNLECRLRNHHGNWVDMEICGYVDAPTTGEALAMYGICMEVSERKAQIKELSELNKKLSLNDQRKSEFLATLSHELRNPLAPIRNVLEIMRLSKTNEPEITRSREIIDRNVAHMSRLIEDLMDISRISRNRVKLRTKTMDIMASVDRAIEETSPLMNACKHKFTTEVPTAPIYVDADASRLVQIFSNLLNNAAKYTPQGGIIHLTIAQHDAEVIISVKDSGIGIPAEELSNIFTMFSQLTPALERAQGGLGIGLSLVSQLVSLHGGSVKVHSEGCGKGSEFVVKLPISHKAPRVNESPPNANTIQTPYKLQHRILVIDDNEDTAESLAQLLEYNGHITRTAMRGQEGVELAKAFSPNVILSDIGLPDITGFEVAKQVRETMSEQNIYMVAITGWGQQKDKALALESGFDRHITKPLDFTELKQILATVGSG